MVSLLGKIFSFFIVVPVEAPLLMESFSTVRRTPRPFPKIFVKRQVTDIADFTFDDFEVVGYEPHPKIAMEMAV
jgi:thymidylate synthase